jgi:Predicted membrane protein
MTELDIAVYFGLFTAALVAATLLPAQSELVLAGLLSAGDQPAWALITVAWAGNTLGSMVNWALGSFFYHLRDCKWFPIKQKSLGKAQHWYRKYPGFPENITMLKKNIFTISMLQ